MADIAKCSGESPEYGTCPWRDRCKRYTAPVDVHQAWIACPGRRGMSWACAMFMHNGRQHG